MPFLPLLKVSLEHLQSYRKVKRVSIVLSKKNNEQNIPPTQHLLTFAFFMIILQLCFLCGSVGQLIPSLHCYYKKRTEMDPARWIQGTGTEEDALKGLVRYHGSTNARMLLHTDDDRIKSNINKFVHVSSLKPKQRFEKRGREAKWRGGD